MPEGDTIHRIQARVAPILTGVTIERATTQGLIRNLAGRTVKSVEAHGKHLVIDLDDGTHVRVHLGMNGRFRLYGRAEGEAIVARTSPGRASLVLATAEYLLLWLTAPTVDISHRRAPRHGMAVASLGPDILTDAFDAEQAADAAVADPDRAIANVLLDQRVASGIGNVYKCEALFAAGVDPRTPAGDLDRAKRVQIYDLARRQMVSNLGPGMRNTRALLAGTPRGDTQRYFVYSRSGKP
ncbi:MAG TPA: DNA-formamidopyrimidine glycosylase family protein, partial [Kofleriaceae bacterium]